MKCFCYAMVSELTKKKKIRLHKNEKPAFFRSMRLPLCRLIPIIMYICTVLVGFSPALFAQDALAEGKKLLLNNQPDKAIPLFRKAASEGKNDPKISLYLGVCYIVLGKYAEAEQQLLTGKDKDPLNTYLYLYNLGNIYFQQSRFTEAAEAYNAVLMIRKAYSPAVLNRANTYIKLEKYEQALNDYKFYLNLEPATSQKQAIQRMVSLLEMEQRETSMFRMQEDAKRIAEETERRAAEERYRKLQEEINANLQSVDNVASISAGSNETLDYSEDYNLE